MQTMNMLVHLRTLRDYAQHAGLKLELRMNDLNLAVSGNGRYYEFVPGFFRVQPDQKQAVVAYRMPVPGVEFFSGWRFHPLKQWALANDKLAFKRYCLDRGLRTPRWFEPPEDADCEVLVKSFVPGERLRVNGPIGATHAKAMLLESGSYAEEFIRGTLLQIWYWDGHLACAEARSPAMLAGNGRNSIRELLALRRPPLSESALSRIDACLGHQHVTLDTVIPAQKEVLLDARHDSPLATALPGAAASAIFASVGSQLRDAGPILWRGIPEQVRPHTLFTINAVVDPQRQVWFTDMQANPLVHPDVYPAMLGHLFDAAIPVPAILAPAVPKAPIAPPPEVPPLSLH